VSLRRGPRIPYPAPDHLDAAPQTLVVAFADAALLAVERALDSAHPILAATRHPKDNRGCCSPPSASPSNSSMPPPNSPTCSANISTRYASTSRTSTTTSTRSETLTRSNAYPRETVVAEKFHTMVYLRTANSRVNDFYGVWLLASHFLFDGKVLTKAVSATFANRETAIGVAPVAFTSDFTEQASTLTQWRAFRSRLSQKHVREKLSDITMVLTVFLLPVARACASNVSFEMRWAPLGPWASGS
jgi:hypothetical protein